MKLVISCSVVIEYRTIDIHSPIKSMAFRTLTFQVVFHFHRVYNNSVSARPFYCRVDINFTVITGIQTQQAAHYNFHD